MPNNNRFFIPAIFLFISIYLIFLSVPRLIANLQATFSDSVYQSLYSSNRPSNDSIVEAIEDLKSVFAWYQNPYFEHQVGHFLYRLIYSDQYEEDEYLKMTYSAIKANRKCLTLSPVEPYVWYRLAVSRFIIDEKDKRIINLLKLSIYTSRNEYNLFMRRLIFLSDYAGFFDEELMALVNDQIRLIWYAYRRPLVKAAINYPELKALVSGALLPEELVIFNNHFDKTTFKKNRQEQ